MKSIELAERWRGTTCRCWTRTNAFRRHCEQATTVPDTTFIIEDQSKHVDPERYMLVPLTGSERIASVAGKLIVRGGCRSIVQRGFIGRNQTS